MLQTSSSPEAVYFSDLKWHTQSSRTRIENRNVVFFGSTFQKNTGLLLAHLLRVVQMAEPFVSWSISWFIVPLNHPYFSHSHINVIDAPLAEVHSPLILNGLFRKEIVCGFCKFGKIIEALGSVLNNCISSFVYFIFLCFVPHTNASIHIVLRKPYFSGCETNFCANEDGWRS